MMFGNGVAPDMFVRLILGIDQQQTLTMLQGLLYHTLFLDAFSGGTATLDVLHQLILAFGLIGFTFLALQRSLWTAPVLLSWLTLTLLLVLGARGSDVLYTPLDSSRAALLGTLKQQKFQEEVTGQDDAVDSVKFSEGITGNAPATGPGEAAGIAPPKLGDMLTKSIDKQYEQLNVVGGFTPMMATVYVFNRIKYELLKGLALNVNVDILGRAGIASKVAAGTLYPSTQYLLSTLVNQCMDGNLAKAMLDEGMIYLHPDKVKNLKFVGDDKTLQQIMQARVFTYNDIYQMQRRYFDDAQVPSDQKTFVGAPMAEAQQWTGAPALAFWTSGNGVAESRRILSLYREGQRLGNAETEAYIAERDKIMKSAPPAEKPGALPGTLALSLIKVSAYKADDADDDDDDTDLAVDKMTAKNCWDVYTKFHEYFQENFGIDEITGRVGKQTFNEAQNNMSISVDGKMIVTPGGSQEKNNDAVLYALARQCLKSCFQGYAQCGADEVQPGTANNGTYAEISCADAHDNYVNAKKLAMAGALKDGLGEIAAVNQYFRNSSEAFSSPIRKYTAKAGELLGPVALWFFALFGGFAAGAYGAIVPSFINFALMMIFAISPFMFMMGILMPGWAPQVIMTPIVVIAYLKLVEIMFVVVGVIFASLRIGLENAGLIAQKGFFSFLMFTDGPDVFSSMYDIMVGMAYTSTFAIAGFMIAGVRSPEKIVGALASYGDKTGRIEASEVLKIGTATIGAAKTAKGLYNSGRGLAKGTAKQLEMIKQGEIPLWSSPSFLDEAKLEARGEKAKREGIRANLQMTDEQFMAVTKQQSIDTVNKNAIAGEAAAKGISDGNVRALTPGEVTDKATVKRMEIDKAEFKDSEKQKGALADLSAVGMTGVKKAWENELLREKRGEDVKDLINELEADSIRTLQDTLGDQGFSDYLKQRATNDVYSSMDKSYKESLKRMGYSTEAKDATSFDRTTNTSYEGSGGIDVMTGMFRELLKQRDPSKEGLKLEIEARGEAFKYLKQNADAKRAAPPGTFVDMMKTELQDRISASAPKGSAPDKYSMVTLDRNSTAWQQLSRDYAAEIAALQNSTTVNDYKFDPNGSGNFVAQSKLNPKGARKVSKIFTP